MPKVFATVPGAEPTISHPSGWQGTPTNDRAALAPAEVAADLAKIEGLRVEPDEEAAVTLPPGRYRTADDLQAAVDHAVGDGKLKVKASAEPAPREKE